MSSIEIPRHLNFERYPPFFLLFNLTRLNGQNQEQGFNILESDFWIRRDHPSQSPSFSVAVQWLGGITRYAEMGFDHKNVKRVEEDRLSSLPDELLHKILSCIDMKFAVETCFLSSRWKLVWTSMPCLNFSVLHFGTLHKFAKFVTHVLSHRNHEIEVSSLKLTFHGAANQDFVRKIAEYAFSHNIQELSVISSPKKHFGNYPPSLFTSHSLKHFTLDYRYMTACITPTTPWDFPSLTTLHLSRIILCGDLFSKCVNLKHLTLEGFDVVDVEAVDIITPRLSDLMFIDGYSSKVINVIAPQLENLTLINFSVKYLNAPAGLASLCYRGYADEALQLSQDGFHSLNRVDICLTIFGYSTCKDGDARKIISLLQEAHSARHLKLNADIVEYLSLFPDLLSHRPSPFSNLVCLTIDASMKKGGYKVKVSSQVLNFFLDNSPSAMFIMESP